MYGKEPMVQKMLWQKQWLKRKTKAPTTCFKKENNGAKKKK